jgi:hypothetical protein
MEALSCLVSAGLLQTIASQFRYNPSDANYDGKFRNPFLSLFTPDKLLLLYLQKGIDGVRA